ncbi:SirB2 family protein [Gilvimarinus sp. 1_MG-2023]|uniref:SirB2 family protein n=1 Tax=Gilvimarinus sp. 1_MG-2023 TaxID=3062638 RepID=UPI0026E1EDF2|nr:SirB2 family protein [Gilvimarinus sp. 1_MG-2023]MDO6745607.1 SirB2 family protein [Gilvimarinus sp. 1_MG-2023]
MGYMALKHTHLLLIVLSIGLFFLRFIATQCNARFIHAKPFKIAPHIIDTALLLSGISLIILVGYPLWPINWLTVKLLLVVAYIGCGIVAMKSSTKAIRWGAAAGALLCIAGILHLALSKSF